MILLFPYPKPLRNGKISAKNYPYWEELVTLLQKEKYPLVQVGISGEKQLVPDFRTNLPLSVLVSLVKECTFWVSCDSFAQHLAINTGKRGAVLWGTSHPEIFGYASNCNILKSKYYLREDPYYWWEDEPFNPDAFLGAGEVFNILKEQFINKQ